jgi:hypothetical protein
VTGPIVLAAFRDTVTAYGIPASTLTDNGMVFTTRLSGGKGGRNGLGNTPGDALGDDAGLVYAVARWPTKPPQPPPMPPAPKPTQQPAPTPTTASAPGVFTTSESAEPTPAPES